MRLEQVNVVELALPLGPETQDYASRHLQIQLSGNQAGILRRLLDGLDHRGDRLMVGRRVQNSADAIRWALEEVQRTAEGIPGEDVRPVKKGILK